LIAANQNDSRHFLIVQMPSGHLNLSRLQGHGHTSSHLPQLFQILLSGLYHQSVSRGINLPQLQQIPGSIHASQLPKALLLAQRNS
jgi:hypothetical protein